MTQQANLMANKRSPPVWALAAIMFLGWNEFMAVLFNPIYLIVIAIASLLGWQLYGELDVDGEMQMGAVPGLVSIGAKLWPTLVSVRTTCNDAAGSNACKYFAKSAHVELLPALCALVWCYASAGTQCLQLALCDVLIGTYGSMWFVARACLEPAVVCCY